MARADDLTPVEVEWVLRRAATLDGTGAGTVPLVEPAVVETAALEAGISRDALRQAMAELRASRARENTARRAFSVDVAQPSAAVRAAVDEYLTRAGLAPTSRDGAVTVWEPGPDATGRAGVFRQVSRVVLDVADAPGGSSVRVEVDARPFRFVHVGGATAGGAVAGLGPWAALAGAWPMTVFVGGAGVALAATEVWQATVGYRRRVNQAAAAIEAGVTSLEAQAS